MKVLIIQTAFLGDAILMSSMVESIAQYDSSIEIHVLVRKGHGVLFENNPHVTKVWEFNKERSKIRNLVSLISEFRNQAFDVVFNCHRFTSTGVITVGSGAKTTVGFNKNPLSLLYKKKLNHEYGKGIHEIDRNHNLLKAFWPNLKLQKPRLYPNQREIEKATGIAKNNQFVVIAPASIWFTKQYPIKGWRNLLGQLKSSQVFIIGTEGDRKTCEKIADGYQNAHVLAGELSLMESVALISKAEKVYACDSAPTHMASAMNVEIHSVFCSTTADFGFGPISSVNKLHETNQILDCRPCSIHGKSACPKRHFKCAEIEIEIAI
ncbi:MAG: glycosyltransferase family 9 protein [Bacteroidia bacterium]